MKNKYNFRIFLFLFLFGSAYFAKANVDTVIVGQSASFSFSPNSFTINVGDTVMWIWESGSHTTTSTTIPAGATSWDQPMNSSSTTYLYVPAVAGKYNYQCTPHSSMMKGSFTAVSTTGLDDNPAQQKLELYPSIGNGNFCLSGIHNESASLRIFSSNGELVMEKESIEVHESIDLSGIADGIYYVYLISEQERYFAKYIKK